MVPEIWGTCNYLQHVNSNDIIACLPLVDESPSTPCDEDVFELCCSIMHNLQLGFPTDTWGLVALYETLRAELNRILV